MLCKDKKLTNSSVDKFLKEYYGIEYNNNIEENELPHELEPYVEPEINFTKSCANNHNIIETITATIILYILWRGFE